MQEDERPTMSRDDFLVLLDVALKAIDQNLASNGMPPSKRPSHAALDFVEYFITHVDLGGEVTQPGPKIEVMAADWFKPIYKDVAAWYDRRYGARMKRSSNEAITGVVCVFDTPFQIDVPSAHVTPSKPGETIWLQLPDEVLKSEDSLTWLVEPPNLTDASRSDGMKARRHANEVASALRFIRSNLMGVTAGDEKLTELNRGILVHLERAAAQILAAESHSLKTAHWDLQMACEDALKAIAQQRSGTYKESHDLFRLYDELGDDPPNFARTLLSKMLHWEVMVDLRYGHGPEVTLPQTYARYRATLKIVRGAVDSLQRRNLGQARFEIAKAPWLREIGSAAKASKSAE